MPLFILPLYIKPVQEHLLNQIPLLTLEHYLAIRVYVVIAWALIRIFTVKPLLQTYLENAKDKALDCSKHADGFETVRG